MKKIVLVFCLFLIGQNICLAQSNGKYLYHTVEQGETLFGISREYGIQIAEIRALNPEVHSDIKLGQTLLIPFIEKEKEDPSKIYTVKKGDTWYGIARSLDITVESLQKTNSQFIEGTILKPGDKILITSKKKQLERINSKDSTSNGITYHQVKTGETIYGLTRKFNLNKGDLYVLNPSLAEKGLKLNEYVVISSPKLPMPKESLATDDINIQKALAFVAVPEPSEAAISSKSDPLTVADTNENMYELYRIKKGDTLESLLALKNQSEEDVLRLNPELTEGIIPGRYIILPAKTIGSIEEKEENAILPSDSILRVAILLPFSSYDSDSLEINDIQSNSSGKMKIKATAFYAGILMAKDSLEKSGIGYQVKVFDTRNEHTKLKEIANDPFLLKANFTIGPFYGNNVSHFAELMKHRNPELKIISPLSSQLEINGAQNVWDLMPNEEYSIDLLSQYFRENYADSKLVLLAAETKEGKERKKRFLDQIMEFNPEIEVQSVALDENGKTLPKDSIIAAKSNDKATVYVAFGKSTLYLSDLVRNLQGFEDELILMTVYEWVEIPMVELNQLNEIQLISPRKFYLNSKEERVKRFDSLYSDTYGKTPDLFGYQGWDCLMYLDYLMKIESGQEIKNYKALQSDILVKKTLDGEFINGSLQLVQLKNMNWQKLDLNR